MSTTTAHEASKERQDPSLARFDIVRTGMRRDGIEIVHYEPQVEPGSKAERRLIRTVTALFLLTIPMAIVSVYIAYSDGILYPMYASAPRVWGISPMNDQMIGGLIMWIPGGLFFYTVISIVFFRWNQRGAEDSQAGAQVDWPTASPAPLASPAGQGSTALE